MQSTRRTFLKYSGSAASVMLAHSFVPAIPSSLPNVHQREWEPFQDIRSAPIKELVQRAVDAARAAGATYADVRLTREQERRFGMEFGINERAEIAIGVRALVNGFWGFAAGTVCQPDAVVGVAQQAVSLAAVSGLGSLRSLDLAPTAVIRDEHWTMPIDIDPFEIPIAEIVDFSDGMRRCYSDLRRRYRRYSRLAEQESGYLKDRIAIWKQEKAFGSTEGSYGTQILYRTEGEFEAVIEGRGSSFGSPKLRVDYLSPAGVGWELFSKSSIYEAIERALEKYQEDKQLPSKPTDIGRYPALLDAESVAQFASGTLGVATELDRALGYEANQTGTSYLNTPFEMAGAFKIGSPLLTVTADRTARGAVGTTGWDDEGVKAGELTLIDRGIIQTFQTTRESADWLHQGVSQQQLPRISSGCASAASGGDEPITQTANLRIHPNTSAASYEAMIQGIDKGIVFENVHVMPDFQQSGGVAWGRAYEVRQGKKTAMLAGAAIMFKATELWNSMIALGGTESVRRFGVEVYKGSPAQRAYHSVTTPPILFKDVTVIDVRRKV